MTSNISQRYIGIVQNLRSDRQLAAGTTGTSSSDNLYRYAANTTNTQPLTMQLNGSTATDWVIVQHLFVEVIPS